MVTRRPPFGPDSDDEATAAASRRTSSSEAEASAARDDPAKANPNVGPHPASYVQAQAGDSIPAHLAPAALYVAVTAATLGVVIGLALQNALTMLHVGHLNHIVGNVGRRDWIAALLGPAASASASASSLTTSLKDSAINLLSSTSSSSTPESLLNKLLLAASKPQLHLYLVTVATFHLLEFYVTARYNASKLLTDSFIIWNGTSYHLAHGTALIEFLIEACLMPRYKSVGALSYVGIALIIFGQALRSLAMAQAGVSFSHALASKKKDDHVLVTEGVYSFSRHPSYVGFFYWALGTQLMLQNPISILTFFALLWTFFNDRIRVEEIYLTNFFGQAYRDYKKRVGTGLPFIA